MQVIQRLHENIKPTFLGQIYEFKSHRFCNIKFTVEICTHLSLINGLFSAKASHNINTKVQSLRLAENTSYSSLLIPWSFARGQCKVVLRYKQAKQKHGWTINNTLAMHNTT